MKKLFIMLTALALAGSLCAGVNYNTLSAPESGNTAAFIPGSDNSTDIGSIPKEFKDLYIDGTANIDTLVVDAISGDITVSGDATVTGDLRTSAVLGITPQEIEMSSATTITPTGSFVVLVDTVGVTCTPVNEPFIANTNFTEGDFLVLTTSGTDIYILTEGVDYNLQLGGSTRTLGEYDSLMLVYRSSDTAAGSWWFQEVSFVDN